MQVLLKVSLPSGLRQELRLRINGRNVEAYRPEKRFGDALKGLFIYGAKVVDVTQFAGTKVG